MQRSMYSVWRIIAGGAAGTGPIAASGAMPLA